MTDRIAVLARFLAANLPWMRHRPEVDEFAADVAECASRMRGLVNGPAPQRYLGPCGAVRKCEGLEPDDWPEGDCGDHTPHDAHEFGSCTGDVYAPRDGSNGRCRSCGAEVSTDLRRAWLDAEARSHAFRAAHIAEAYRINVNTIRSWALRGLLKSYWRTSGGLVIPWTEVAEQASATRLHYVGDVLDLYASEAARRAEGQAKRARRAAARAAESETAA